MRRIPLLISFSALLALAGCYSDQKKQLAQCEAGATHAGDGQPLRSIRACMEQAGYNFVGFANTKGVTVECDLPSVIQGKPSQLGTDAQCFEPKGWLQLHIYRWEVPVRLVPAAPSDQSQ